MILSGLIALCRGQAGEEARPAYEFRDHSAYVVQGQPQIRRHVGFSCCLVASFPAEIDAMDPFQGSPQR